MNGKREQISDILDLIQTGQMSADEGYARVTSIQNQKSRASNHPLFITSRNGQNRSFRIRRAYP